MTVGGIRTGGRAEQRERLAGADAASQLVDGVGPLAHLGEVALAVLGPGQRRRASLAVERGEELWGGAQLLAPLRAATRRRKR